MELEWKENNKNNILHALLKLCVDPGQDQDMGVLGRLIIWHPFKHNVACYGFHGIVTAVPCFSLETQQ
jgi:hypothetical protein